MFRGLATISFYADDVPAAAKWYTELLAVDPYYAFPPPPAPAAYIEFRVGDDQDEFGIIDRQYAPVGAANVPGGAVAFWHVDDLAATVEQLAAMGATVYEPLTERESGFSTASFIDPFGNVLGIMANPHYLEIQARRNPS
ncbi:VOC family protein [Arthrobacter sp. H35-D1]|uniref:VOC family protein n=1 Tax=Arthrobacter sp. H35-D1 TaxID=3046202 RepID=UPI0024B914EF|nr:VOC family protein [Arthrobacter sp. H35-D1]MDJ0311812.1 VOC family protein [Arthrobacter sp. H35-D1]